ncbi:MAG: tryptophanase [Mycobacterium sp.]|uniref:hypothetical protein n=1 Tax=Mycobacterium sp. TaxID=1785 RepID=UPI003BB0A8B8
MKVSEEIDLAWTLAGAGERDLSQVERNEVYAAIGVGETFAAIRSLITSTTGKRMALPADLVARCASWLDFYLGHEDEQHLRRLIEDILAPCAIRSDNLH